MEKINLTKIIVWLIMAQNVAVLMFFIPFFLKDYTEFQELSWRMDSTQNSIIKKLVEYNNKLVDNQNALFEEMMKNKKE